MQNGRITPLGRRLKSVLVNLTAPDKPRQRCFSLKDDARNRNAIEHGFDSRAARHIHTCRTLKAPGEAIALAEDLRAHDGEEINIDGRRFKTRSGRALNRLPAKHHLTEALREADKDALDTLSAHRGGLRYNSSVQKGNAKVPLLSHQQRTRTASGPFVPPQDGISIQHILSKLIQHQVKANDYLEAEWEQPFEPTPLEAEYLHAQGYALSDLEAFAAITTAQDALIAVEKLQAYFGTHRPDSVPIFVYLNLLRRKYVSARALRLLINQVSATIRHRARNLPDPDIDRADILLVVARSLRHARKVWPPAMPSIVKLLLGHFENRESTFRAYRIEQLAPITYALNKVMSLISHSTAVQPFKDNPYQEAALVPVLQYMAEHRPPLQIDRQGYRAVIRLQLAQRKRPNELQWAELKALSWPPWKTERTAMDALIDVESGISTAASTLSRMREAGYRPMQWEKAAASLAGWDSDGTPTIQTRALLMEPEKPTSRNQTSWKVRIIATRTIQEAWACFLAWEDSKLPHDQEVYLAIFEKLREEEMRQHSHRNYKPRSSSRTAWPLLPGDGKEIAPLPPSTHLYTYTRTPPPTVVDFYDTLVDRGVVFKGQCLAFLIQHAPSLEAGIERLQRSQSAYPDIAGITGSESSCDLSKVPSPIFTATIQLFSRFGHIPLTKLPGYGPSTYNENRQALKEGSRAEHRLNPKLAISRAIYLLQARATTDRPMWNAALQGLTRETIFPGLGNALCQGYDLADSPKVQEQRSKFLQLPVDVQWAAGALNAYRIAGRIHALMRRKSYLDPDIVTFHNLCISLEHMIVGSWRVFNAELGDDSLKENSTFVRIRRDARELRKVRFHHHRLKSEFSILVGDDDAVSGPDAAALGATTLPPLLTVPGPAILHAYIRALGWYGDYGGLFDTVRWMHRYKAELAERQSHDRRGQDMMRKSIVALRVFLERSWVPEEQRDMVAAVGEEHSGAKRDVESLNQLKRSADSSIIERVKEIVESVEEWEGWPDDDEVEEYAADKRFKRVMGVAP